MLLGDSLFALRLLPTHVSAGLPRMLAELRLPLPTRNHRSCHLVNTLDSTTVRCSLAGGLVGGDMTWR
jgi:hypothetical protein